MLRILSLMSVLVILFFSSLRAQKKIVLEAINYATAINYLQDPLHFTTLITSLDASLQKQMQARISDTDSIKLVDISKPFSRISFRHASDDDTSCLHMLVNFSEHLTDVFFDRYADVADPVLRTVAKRVLQVEVLFFRHDKTLLYSSLTDIFITHSAGPGLGHQSGNLALMPRSFVEIMKIAFHNILDTANSMRQMTVKNPPVYATDNYIIPEIQGKPRIVADTKNGIIAYLYNDGQKMLRLGEPFFEEMLVRGRKAIQYPAKIKKAVNEAPNSSASDFVCLRQESRDVLADKNYLLQIYTQINPRELPLQQALLFTNFLPGQLHTLANDKDTVALFSIRKNIHDTAKKIFPGTVYNGLNSESLLKLPGRDAGVRVVHPYIVEGLLNGAPFTIKCSGEKGFIKEIYFKEKLVCIAQGNFRPEVFAVFDASLSSETLNQLFIIGFNCFFE